MRQDLLDEFSNRPVASPSARHIVYPRSHLEGSIGHRRGEPHPAENRQIGEIVSHEGAFMNGAGRLCERLFEAGELVARSQADEVEGELAGAGLEVVEQRPIEIESNETNRKYLETKRAKLGHTLKGI